MSRHFRQFYRAPLEMANTDTICIWAYYHQPIYRTEVELSYLTLSADICLAISGLPTTAIGINFPVYFLTFPHRTWRIQTYTPGGTDIITTLYKVLSNNVERVKFSLLFYRPICSFSWNTFFDRCRLWWGRANQDWLVIEVFENWKMENWSKIRFSYRWCGEKKKGCIFIRGGISKLL